jgi:hypothetical protein
MPGAEYGFKRAISEGLTGLVISAVITTYLKSTGDTWLLILFNLASMASIFLFIKNIPFWSIAYLCGWLFSLFIIGQYLFEWWELLIYFIAGGLFLYIKFKNHFD